MLNTLRLMRANRRQRHEVRAAFAGSERSAGVVRNDSTDAIAHAVAALARYATLSRPYRLGWGHGMAVVQRNEREWTAQARA